MMPFFGIRYFRYFSTLLQSSRLIFMLLNAKLAFYEKSQMCELFIVTEIRKPRVVNISYLNCVCLCTGLVKNKYIF